MLITLSVGALFQGSHLFIKNKASALKSYFLALHQLRDLAKLSGWITHWFGISNMEVCRAWRSYWDDPQDDFKLPLLLRAGCWRTARVMDPDLWVVCHGNVVHSAGAPRERLRQSPDQQHGQETPCSGPPSVLLHRGGEHNLLQALYKFGLYWRSLIQGKLVWIQLILNIQWK